MQCKISGIRTIELKEMIYVILGIRYRKLSGVKIMTTSGHFLVIHDGLLIPASLWQKF